MQFLFVVFCNATFYNILQINRKLLTRKLPFQADRQLTCLKATLASVDLGIKIAAVQNPKLVLITYLGKAPIFWHSDQCVWER